MVIPISPNDCEKGWGGATCIDRACDNHGWLEVLGSFTFSVGFSLWMAFPASNDVNQLAKLDKIKCSFICQDSCKNFHNIFSYNDSGWKMNFPLFIYLSILFFNEIDHCVAPLHKIRVSYFVFVCFYILCWQSINHSMVYGLILHSDKFTVIPVLSRDFENQWNKNELFDTYQIVILLLVSFYYCTVSKNKKMYISLTI